MPLQPPKPEETRNFYESIDELYPRYDHWHRITHAWIKGVVESESIRNKLKDGYNVLNLGSAGVSYSFPEQSTVHVDIHEKGFRRDQNLIIADINHLPLIPGRFMWCLCVGSVINYCDAAAVIAGISRHLLPGGRLLLEFESSYSYEYYGRSAYCKSAGLVNTTYQGQAINLWAYSPQYIESILKSSGYRIDRIYRKHIISTAFYRAFPYSNIAAVLHRLDSVIKYIPFARKHAHNIILSCEKL